MDYTLHITDRCNLRCKYCYENKGNQDLSFDNIKSILDFAVKNKEKKSNITFYGGEPLLKKDIIYKTVEYCQKLEQENEFKFMYSLNTNGTLIDEEFINFARQNLVHICYSIDGIKECHNLNRNFENGGNSYDVVVENVKKLLKEYSYVTVMMVVTTNNIQYLYDNVKHLFELGFVSVIFSLDYTANWNDEYLKILRAQYKKLAKLYIEKTMNEEYFYLLPFEHKIDVHISKDKMCAERCQLGLKHVNIGTNGKIYPCMQFVGINEFEIGDCINGIDPNKQLTLMKKSSKECSICRECDLKERCKHTCGCINMLASKDMNSVSPIVCETERMIIEISDEIASILYKKRANMFIQKKYNKMFPVIEMMERRRKDGIKICEKI